MRLKHLVLPVVTAFGVALLGLSALWKPDPRLIYNPSTSAPIGWYRIDPDAEISAGMVVASSLADEAERLADGRRYLPQGTPVIKTVWAVPGDAYCVREDSLTVRETDFSLAVEDSSGRELPRLEPGCRTVAEGHVLLLSDIIGNSFDSRYFGEVSLSLVIGEAVYLGRDRSGKVGDGAGARAWGAQGKIKGPSAAGGLGRCLHISFKGAVETSAALRFGRFLSEISALGQRHFTPFHPTSSNS
jgi:conjugative transfer signal peptidase TraF